MNSHPICFDATGTLIELKEDVGEVYRRVALDFGVDLPAWRLRDAFGRILLRAPSRSVDGGTVAARQIGEVEWWFERVRETFQATDSTVRFDDFQAFAAALFDVYRDADAWRLRPGVVEVLGLLRAQKSRLAIVSNFDHRLPSLLEMLEIADFFSIISIPSESRSIKPDQAAFEFVANALECPVESLIYVGDDEKDVLETIAIYGLRVFDVREIEDLESLPAMLATAATLPRP